ncbi:MAG: Zn-ribbon domain-containing OB-fold protein [Synergistetes bacterium]|nr:Zn-ribbon domain-containing OB-fold protein [Synergistota bacterium]
MFTVPRIRREEGPRYRLEASKCERCGFIYYPPRLICPRCRSKELKTIKLPEEGRIISYTVIRVPPRGFSQFAPYPVAIVELTNGVRLTLQVVDCDINEIDIGKKVRLVFRRLFVEGDAGPIIYGPKCTLTC